MAEIAELEIGNVLQIIGSEITGSVVNHLGTKVEMYWSDGETSIESLPIIGVEFV